MNLSPFGRAFDPCILHALPVAVRATKNWHLRFSSLEFGEAKLEINDGLVDPNLTPAPGAAIVVFLRRGSKGNLLLLALR